MNHDLEIIRRPVELLLPVGNMQMALAAIHNGADAIFLGMPGFNARGRSHDFDLSTLEEIIAVCHLYRVKVNVAFNIVIFEEELASVIPLLQTVLPLKPDALIVQDLGVARLIREMAPHQRIHASTQMTVTNHEAIHLLEDLNIQRFVLGRENSIEEIQIIRSKTDKELEVFVHGALCVSYSGQCFTSESIGGRSANRGQCAQSCRFSYEMYVDGEQRDLGTKKYLVSPQDLCGLDEVPELVRAGVDCFKVEGRLKTPEYVATSARAYRNALENQLKKSNSNFLKDKSDMAVSYSRGFFSGWLRGVNHQKLVQGKYSAHRGLEIGKIQSVQTSSFIFEATAPEATAMLTPGDGLLWANQNQEQGGFIYGIKQISPSSYKVEFSREIKITDNFIGAVVYQNHNKELKRELSQTIEDKNKKKRLEIDIEIKAHLNQPLWARITDGEYSIEGSTSKSIEEAHSSGVTDEQFADEFSALSGSIFKLRNLKIERNSHKQIFIAHKEFKNLRQILITELTNQRTKSEKNDSKNLIVRSETEMMEWIQPRRHQAFCNKPKLNLLLREKGQVSDITAAMTHGNLFSKDISSVILDFEFARDYEECIRKLKDQGIRVGLATTRILKPLEYKNIKFLTSLKPDIILVRNLGALQYLNQEHANEFELRGDFSLNISNHLTAKYLLGKGLTSICLSYDLNHSQVSSLLQNMDSSRAEVTIYQYMPSFHMEHCVFANTLSQGSSFRDCGKPCEKHQIKLRDQFNNWHHIKADPECRNTMFNAKSQTASKHVNSWQNLGLGHVRYEALKEREQELIAKIASHIDFLKGLINHEELVEKIGSMESYGISDGSLSKEVEYQSRKKTY
jgi:putative protease